MSKLKLGIGVFALALTAALGSGVFPTQQADTPPSKKGLLDASHAFNEIARKAMPAVVSVSVVKRGDPASEEALQGLLPFMNPHSPGDPYSEPPIEGAMPDRPDARSVGIGSGVIIRKDGMILTNHHVVENGERITVTLDEKHKRGAHVVGIDPKTDLAVIKVDPPKKNDGLKELQTLDFGDSDAISVGDWAIAVGSPFGLNRSVTSGIVSAKGRAQMGILDVEDFIQTDAPINPGSSGGPLLNIDGKIIGLNTAIFSQGGGFVGIGFAIPSKIAKEISDQLMTKGKVSRGWIGLSAQDLDPELARYFKAPENQKGEPQGALVSDVQSHGPAKDASIEVGDVVLKYNDQNVTNAAQFKSLVGKTLGGTQVKLELLRSGKNEIHEVKILQQPEEKLPVAQKAGTMARSEAVSPSFGLAVEDVPSEIARFLQMPGMEGALVVNVDPGSPAFDSGLTPGDIILKAGKTSIVSARQFKKVAKEISRQGKKDDLTVLYVQRGPEEKVFVPLKKES